MIKGKTIILRSTRLDEIELFYSWATQSDGAKYWYGELYGDTFPTTKEFREDWKDHYFTHDQPEKGQSFIILANDKPIGQINYNQIDRKDNSVELDILIADDENEGKGYGSDALLTLARYLIQYMNVSTCWVDAVETNERAIHAYEKAGFQQVKRFSQKGKNWIHLEKHSKSSS